MRHPRPDHTRRGHENVDAPEALDNRGHCRLYRLLVADVGLLKERARRAVADPGPGVLRRPADVDAGDGGALGGKTLCRGQADAGRDPRDDCYPSLQTIHVCSCVVAFQEALVLLFVPVLLLVLAIVLGTVHWDSFVRCHSWGSGVAILTIRVRVRARVHFARTC